MVIIDTAGRLGIDEEMMGQAAAIRDAVQPDEILFVVDAMIGQDAVATAQAFLDGVGYDGVVLTKLDGDARGGAALSITQLTGRPIMFASAGEKLADFDVFHPDRMASRILDMGDMLTLIEQAEKAFDEDQAAAIADRLVSGEGFTLEDFVEQIQMVRKLGPLGNLLGMLPGAGKNKELLSQVNDKDLDRATAIVQSMTPEERRNPKIINGSRRARIANGSGVAPGQVARSSRTSRGPEADAPAHGRWAGQHPGHAAGHAPRREQGGQEQEGQEAAPGRRPAPRGGPAAGNGAPAEDAVPGTGAPAAWAPACRRGSATRTWPRRSPRCRRAACPAAWAASPASAPPTATSPPPSALRATSAARRSSPAISRPPRAAPATEARRATAGWRGRSRSCRPRRLTCPPVPQHAGEAQRQPPGYRGLRCTPSKAISATSSGRT